MTNEIAVDLIESIGVMAFVAIIYGMLLRSSWRPSQKSVAGGLLFGAAAIVSMIMPVVMAPGVIMDARSVFVGLGAAFGGPVVAIISAVMAGSYRWFAVGGVGALPGTIGIFMAAGLGYLWVRVCPYKGRPTSWQLAIAGAMISLQFLAVYIMPWEQANQLMVTVYPLLLAASIVSALVLGFFVEREHRQIESEKNLKRAADRDFLTNLFNRRAFQAAATKLERSGAETEACHVMAIFDLDHFKSINDNYGHDMGDKALIAFADLLQKNTRANDIVSRLGGEEFGILMRRTTIADAQRAVERILGATRDLKVEVPGGKLLITASAGVVEYWPAESSLDQVMGRADKALYIAKNSGRDRAEIVGLGAVVH